MSTYLQYNNHMILHPTDSNKYLSELLEPVDEVTIGTQTWKMHNLTIDDGLGGIYCQVVNFGHGDQLAYYYTWEAANRIASKIEGWHLPTKYEWQTLIDYVGGNSVAGTKLKSTFGWPYGGAGTDDYGFEALPAGSYTDLVFMPLWINVYFWTATPGPDDLADNYAYMVYFPETASVSSNYISKGFGFQVRLIKGDTPPDPPEPPDPPIPTDEVIIGTQTWKNKNLAIDDGQGGIYTQTVNYGQGNVIEYYYTMDAAVRVAATVTGWHIPSDNEWVTLINTIGSDTAGTKLKSTYGWAAGGSGTDDYGFSAFPAGYWHSDSFSSSRVSARFWTTTPISSTNFYYRTLSNNSEKMSRLSANGTTYAYQIRLVKDS